MRVNYKKPVNSEVAYKDRQGELPETKKSHFSVLFEIHVFGNCSHLIQRAIKAM